MMSSTLADSLDYQVLASGLDHVEGICWDAARQCLWAGGEAGQIYRIELDGSFKVVATIDGGALLGIALDAEGSLYIADPGNHQVWKVDAKYVVTAFGDSIDYPNYPAFAPDGRLFVSDSGGFASATGEPWSRSTSIASTRVPTRPSPSPTGSLIDDTTLWIIESAAPAVSAMPLDGGALDRVIAMERCPGRSGLRCQRRTTDLVLSTESVMALDQGKRAGTDLLTNGPVNLFSHPPTSPSTDTISADWP